jgi:hypothetical protein
LAAGVNSSSAEPAASEYVKEDRWVTFDELLAQVIELLQRQGRLSYGALKRRFWLDDAYLQDLRDELIDAQQVALDEDGKILIWRGRCACRPKHFKVAGAA